MSEAGNRQHDKRTSHTMTQYRHRSQRAQIRDEWRSRKQFSSDDTEEEAAPYKTRNVTLQDSVDSKQLAEARIHNKMLLSKTNHSDIKQDVRVTPGDPERNDIL